MERERSEAGKDTLAKSNKADDWEQLGKKLFFHIENEIRLWYWQGCLATYQGNKLFPSADRIAGGNRWGIVQW
jgi:hypothetical protein